MSFSDDYSVHETPILLIFFNQSVRSKVLIDSHITEVDFITQFTNSLKMLSVGLHRSQIADRNELHLPVLVCFLSFEN